MTIVDTQPADDVDLLAEVHRIISTAVHQAGSVPALGSPAWWTCGPSARLAGLLVLAEAWLVTDPHRVAAEMVKDASVAISTGLDWRSAAHTAAYESHAVLVRRRAEPGPLARSVDREAAARWAATGTGDREAA